MSSTVPELWEVWHARFDFSEGKSYKYRPVIISELRKEGRLSRTSRSDPWTVQA